MLTINHTKGMSHKQDVMLYGCAITRFTDETYQENKDWCDQNGYTKHQCVYNSLSPTPHNMRNIPNLFIIEMNITQKQVVGVGLVKNARYCKQRVRMHSDPKYNYYTYVGNQHMNINDFTELERERIANVLNKCLFTGYTHLIRGTGYSRLPYPLVHKTGRGLARVETKHRDDFIALFRQAFYRHFKKLKLIYSQQKQVEKENGDTEQQREGNHQRPHESYEQGQEGYDWQQEPEQVGEVA